MKESIESSDRMIFTSVEISRRELLRAGVSLGVTISGLGIVSGCAAPEAHKDSITPTKEIFDYKIYPPNEGCFVGFYKRDVPSRCIHHYNKTLSAKPSLFALWQLLSEGFPMVETETIKDNGVLPYVNVYPGLTVQKGWKTIFDSDEVAKGTCDSYIKQIAKYAVRFGKKHGSFFFTTMAECNAAWWPWSRTPHTTQAIRHFWEIFEDEGANKYATWTWEAFCPTGYQNTSYGSLVSDPESYYPGVKYVDWIGMNVFANLKNRSIKENTMFRDLLTPTYELMVKNHPQKTMMISEFGRTPGENQPLWLIDAYGSMRKEFPRIKSAIYYDNVTDVYGGQDHRLDQRSLNTINDIFKDPYWIMAK